MENAIYRYVERNHIKTPIQLEIGLDKVVYSPYDGKDTRYLRVFINGKDVTTMVANATHHKISYARDTYGCLIIHGSNMDMGFALQDRMYRAAYIAGHKNMFDRDLYTYIGKRNHGKYPYLPKSA